MENKSYPDTSSAMLECFMSVTVYLRWAGMLSPGRATPGDRMSLSIVKARGAVTPLTETRVIYLLRPEVALDPENVDRSVPPAHHKRRRHETERRSPRRWTNGS
jgi:hypothetical protein